MQPYCLDDCVGGNGVQGGWNIVSLSLNFRGLKRITHLSFRVLVGPNMIHHAG